MSTVIQPGGAVYVTNASGGNLYTGKPAKIANRVGIVVKQDARDWDDALVNPEVVANGEGCLLLVDGVTEVDDTTPAAALGDLVYVKADNTLTTNAITDEIETLTVSATGGTYKLTYSGQETGTINHNAAPATVQTALEALSNIAPGDVTVTGGVGNAGGTNPYVITFGGALKDANITQITADSTSLTGGAGTATPGTTTQGGTAATALGRCVAAVGTRGLRSTQIRVDLSDKG